MFTSAQCLFNQFSFVACDQARLLKRLMSMNLHILWILTLPYDCMPLHRAKNHELYQSFALTKAGKLLLDGPASTGHAMRLDLRKYTVKGKDSSHLRWVVKYQKESNNEVF